MNSFSSTPRSLSEELLITSVHDGNKITPGRSKHGSYLPPLTPLAITLLSHTSRLSQLTLEDIDELIHPPVRS